MAFVPTRSGTVILMYHRIADADSDPALCLSPATFAAHLEALRTADCDVVPLSTLRRASDDRQVRNRVVLTFDDGYSEMLSIVAPLLVGHGFPFTAFLVGRTLDGLSEFWWDLLHRVLRPRPDLPPVLEIELGERSLQLPTRTVSECTAARKQVGAAMHGLSWSERDSLIDSLLDWSGLDRCPETTARPLTAAEIRAMSAMPGCEIGAHTENHAWLPAETPQERSFQVGETKRRLERLLGRAVTSFAYPYGVWDEATLKTVAEAGYELAVTTTEQAVAPGDNRLLLPRVDAGASSVEEFADTLHRNLGSLLQDSTSLSPVP